MERDARTTAMLVWMSVVVSLSLGEAAAAQPATQTDTTPAPRARPPAASARVAPTLVVVTRPSGAEPMLDRAERLNIPLDSRTKDSPFSNTLTRSGGEKRGLKTSYLVAAPEKAPEKVSEPVPNASLINNVYDMHNSKRSAGITSRRENCDSKNLHPEQHTPVGCMEIFSDGSKTTMVAFDPSRPYGVRHHYKYEMPGAADSSLYASPLVFDLNGDGVRMSRRSTSFDAQGARRKEAVNDISQSDGLLVLDIDHDGSYVSGGLEVLGTGTDIDGDHKPDGYADGFEALRALVGRALSDRTLDASFDGRVLGPAQLKSLAKAYGLRMRVGGTFGRVVTLDQAGVRAIHLPEGDCVRVKDFDGQGNETLRCVGAVFTRANGTTGAYEDVWFQL